MWLTTNSKGGINSDAEFFFGATANGMCMLLLVQTIGAIGGDKSFFTVSGYVLSGISVARWQNVIPHPPPWRNPRKERDQILPPGNSLIPLRFYSL